MKRSLLIITTKSMLDTVVYNIRNFNYEMFHVARCGSDRLRYGRA